MRTQVNTTQRKKKNSQQKSDKDPMQRGLMTIIDTKEDLK
jgi:hypothetical protein